jgi:enoyl-CoA hydratase/carnithine racemase
MTSNAQAAADVPASGPPLFSIAGHRADIRLNRPAQHNRLENADIALLIQHFAAVEAATEVRVMVLTGTGPTFCSGYDLGALGKSAAAGTAAPEPRGSGFAELTDKLEALRVPTICALNGGVFGGGTDLALACDFRVATERCRMFMPAARIGLQYYPGGLRRYVTRLGLGAAKKLFLTAEPIDAAEMLRIGYLDEIVPEGELAARVDRLAESLAGNAPLSVQGMKKALNDIARADLDEAAAYAAHLGTRKSEDVREGLAAMKEKRKPQFKGR